MIAFGQKHLNDTFHLDGIQSVSARDKILQEIISNLLAHRDFSNAYVAKFVIEKDRIYTENSNLSHGHGALNLATFEPFPKNPPISKVFREIGLADELGSGMRNTYKYTKMYSGGEPQFVEGDVFRITIPLTEVATATVGPEVIAPNDDAINGVINGVINGAINLSTNERKLIQFLKENPYATKMIMSSSLEIGAGTVERIIRKLKKLGLLERVGSNKTGYWRINQ